MMAPSVPGALLTPIAPQSLSFRPLIVPESSLIEIRLPFGSRSHARSVSCSKALDGGQMTTANSVLACRASFDGRHPLRVLRGSTMRCSTSFCALPMVSLGKVEEEWFQGIVQARAALHLCPSACPAAQGAGWR